MWRRGILLIFGLLWASSSHAVRVVSLSPHLTQLLAMLQACDELVAKVTAGTEPSACATGSVVGDAFAISDERLLAARPQIVLVWSGGLSRPRIEHLQHLGLHLVLFGGDSLAGIASDVLRLGEIVGRTVQARQVVENYQQQLRLLSQRYHDAPPLRVFYQVWSSPLITLNRHHYLGDALSLCHLQVISPDSPMAAPQVSPEWVMAQHPDLILLSPGTMPLAQWRQAHLTFLTMENKQLELPTPALMPALDELCRQAQRRRPFSLY